MSKRSRDARLADDWRGKPAHHSNETVGATAMNRCLRQSERSPDWKLAGPVHRMDTGRRNHPEAAMRVLWTLIKVIVGLAIAIPLGVLALGLVGTMIGLAIVALKLACVGLIAYGMFSLARRLFLGSAPKPTAPPRELPPADRYYEAAMRELDSELRT
jgi:hypothetical protein